MSGPRFRVGFMGRHMHKPFMETAAQQPALEVVTLEIGRPEAQIAAMLSGGRVPRLAIPRGGRALRRAPE
jgi:hypothetical protein